jgi:hypothetical protein
VSVDVLASGAIVWVKRLQILPIETRVGLSGHLSHCIVATGIKPMFLAGATCSDPDEPAANEVAFNDNTAELVGQ